MNSEATGKLQQALASPREIILVPHYNPDGDAIGACLGLCRYLGQSGHRARVLAPNDFPQFLKWMPGSEGVLIYDRNPETARKAVAEAELIFTLDFNALDRCGPLCQLLSEASATFVMIDHHQAPDGYAHIQYSDVRMSSTCEMVYNTIEALGGLDRIDAETASCLYAGMLTDTGSFKFASTTPRTMRVAADLMERGAPHTEIHRHIYDTNRPQRLQLLGCALSNLVILPEYRTAYITLSQDELDAHGFQKGDTEGFVNYGLSINNVVLAAIFIENREEGIVKISLRSQGDFSVNDMSRKHFSGGGHINAAGGRSEASLEDTAARFRAILPEYENQLQHA
ncbi:bifunctional oligoribonuclease/PAP phosphatase NrnA [Robiginitalea sp. M366]|uniref:DHH family phosphoesterase n=1 Tax=Robiginitalea aestuariiviva TaxID=3036903 RepID=UPI00240E9A38|nr:bifunctional oligoribonuclease/PAP phosphatase NrnA [Robiginitalea aestuariiviva]MDG1573238.1 bifunctional oligoribonuclease/PAP phosphatase NrnA [Robiginitalea aestuariiviva]